MKIANLSKKSFNLRQDSGTNLHIGPESISPVIPVDATIIKALIAICTPRQIVFIANEVQERHMIGVHGTADSYLAPKELNDYNEVMEWMNEVAPPEPTPSEEDTDKGPKDDTTKSGIDAGAELSKDIYGDVVKLINVDKVYDKCPDVLIKASLKSVVKEDALVESLFESTKIALNNQGYGTD